MILRNKRAEQIFTLFIFMLVTFFNPSIVFAYIFAGLLARISFKWTMLAIALSLLYNSQQRGFFIALYNILIKSLNPVIAFGVDLGAFSFSVFINIIIWRIVGTIIFRRVKKRIPSDIIIS